MALVENQERLRHITEETKLLVRDSRREVAEVFQEHSGRVEESTANLLNAVQAACRLLDRRSGSAGR